MGLFLPGIAVEDADLVEIESGDDYIEGEEARLLISIDTSKFMTVKVGLGMLLYLSPLYGQLAEMLIPLDIVGVVHKEDEKISLDVQQYLAGELKLHRLLGIHIIDLYCMFLLCWGLVVDDLLLFWIAYCSHYYLISITGAVYSEMMGTFIEGVLVEIRGAEGRVCNGIIFIFKIY